MFSFILFILFFICLVLAVSLPSIISLFSKFNLFSNFYKKITNNKICIQASLTIAVIFFLVTSVIFAYRASNDRSLENYYKQLNSKKEIQMQLTEYKEEIKNLKSANIEKINFDLKEKIIELNEKIKVFNSNIYTHRNCKDSWLFNENYNKSIADMEIIEVIF